MQDGKYKGIVKYHMKGGENMQTATKLFSLTLGFALVLAHVFTFLNVASPVNGALMQGARVTLTNPVAGGSSNYQFQFTVPSSAPIREIRFQWSTTATNQSIPTAGMLNAAALGTLSNLDGGWTTLATGQAASGLLELQHTSSQDLNGLVVGATINTVTNSGINACDGQASTDTCYVQIQTSSGTGAWGNQVVDTATITYTVVQAVTVSATVDPTFTFVISSVGANTVIGGVTTSVASTASTLPFGNLTVGSPRYAAHRLNVTTNANSGYTVTMRVSTAMTGTYSSNNIDPFAAAGVAWATPQPWSSPNGGSANSDTAWFGAHVTDAGLSQFDDGEFGPANGTDNTVMVSTTSDNGVNPEYVVYAVEANVYQPADVYTGTVLYTATPTY